MPNSIHCLLHCIWFSITNKIEFSIDCADAHIIIICYYYWLVIYFLGGWGLHWWRSTNLRRVFVRVSLSAEFFCALWKQCTAGILINATSCMKYRSRGWKRRYRESRRFFFCVCVFGVDSQFYLFILATLRQLRFHRIKKRASTRLPTRSQGDSLININISSNGGFALAMALAKFSIVFDY